MVTASTDRQSTLNIAREDVAIRPMDVEPSRMLPRTVSKPVEAFEDDEPMGFWDWVVANYRGAPWWFVSGAFHAVLLMLVTLIGMVILKGDFNDSILTSNIEERDPPKREQPPCPPERKEVALPVDVKPEELRSEAFTVVEHEEMEVAEVYEIADVVEVAEEVRGEVGLAESFAETLAGGMGIYANMGLATHGRMGAFGRPENEAARLRRAIRGGGGKKTEQAVEKALAWLARHQEADGRWDSAKHGARNNVDVSMTGFALLAFLGAGHTEKIGKYKDNVKRAVKWLISRQRDDGCLVPALERNTGYANAIAGMALSEAAGMAQMPDTIDAAELCVEYGYKRHQRKEDGERRGYRYVPQQRGDISNTGWYIMQLKSSKVAGLRVHPDAFDGVAWFLDRVEDKNFRRDAEDVYDTGRHRYGYQRPDQVTPRRTAMGCLTRQFLGDPREELRGGVEWFVNAGGVPSQAKVDLYYWYYGTLCTFQQGEDIWRRWNDGLKSALLPTQHVGGNEDGSWDPRGPYSERWGRVGQTALSCLCLEVYYRYLPMYR